MDVTAGLFDIQVNGFAGIDFNSGDISSVDLDYALEAMRGHGVHGCLPTFISADFATLETRIMAFDAAVQGSRLANRMIPGFHLEGPFLSADEGYRGCHPASAMCDPNSDWIDSLEIKASKPILLVTLAPEREGSPEAVRKLRAKGRTVAIGHSSAGYDKIANAASAGASLSTHLGNGLPMLLPKLENTLLAQLAEGRLKACLIADGIHMSPEALRALVALKGPENSILVTDAVSAAAAPSGVYKFAGMNVFRDEDGRVTSVGSKSLAGSSLCLDEAVKNACLWGVADFAHSVMMASEAPSKALARSLKIFGCQLDLGEIRWNSALEIVA